jgi:hypothetical protein
LSTLVFTLRRALHGAHADAASLGEFSVGGARTAVAEQIADNLLAQAID